jgi:hypothetical protein
MAHWLIFFLLASVAAFAAGPEACDPREDPTVCELKVERNNAMDELAVNAGNLRKARERQVTMTEWWASYVDGIGLQAEWWRQYSEGVNGKVSHHH